MSLRAFDLRVCTVHGHNSLHSYGVCVCCEKNAVYRTPRAPVINEATLPAYQRKVMRSLDGRGKKDLNAPRPDRPGRGITI